MKLLQVLRTDLHNGTHELMDLGHLMLFLQPCYAMDIGRAFKALHRSADEGVPVPQDADPYSRFQAQWIDDEVLH